MYICIFFSFLHLFYGPVHPAVYLLHVICSVSVLLLCFITAQFSHLCGSFGSESMLCNCNIICLVLVLNFPEHSRLCVCVCVCIWTSLHTADFLNFILTLVPCVFLLFCAMPKKCTITGPARQTHQHTGCIYSQHTDGLHENCNNKMILAHFIINWIILIF